MDVRKRRLDRAPGRSGRPQARPLVARLPRQEDDEFRAMVRERSTTVNTLIQALARAELNKYREVYSRRSQESIPDAASPFAGHGLQRDREKAQGDSLLPPSLSATRFRDADTAKRREEAGPAVGRDSPADLR
jgi:hypothetical protein